MTDKVNDATPAKYFAFPPYKAEEFAYNNSGVMNKNGFNCLTFKSGPGVTLTDFDTAVKIAELWNKSND